MRWTLAIAMAAVVAGCAPAEPEVELPQGPPLDPDVQSWSPPSAPLPAVSRVVFMGDSITAGYGITNSLNAYKNLLVQNNDTSWPAFIGDDLVDRYGDDVEVVDVSRSGAETPDVIGSQLDRLEDAIGTTASGPTVVFVTIGGNDLTGALVSNGLPEVADTIEQNVSILAEALTDPARFPDGVLLTMTNVYEPTDDLGQADECFFGLDVSAARPVIDDVNQRMLDLAQTYEFAYVDLRAHFHGHGFNYANASMETYDADDPTLWFQDDCIHPNRRGHHEIRRLFLAATDGEPLELWKPDGPRQALN